MSKKMQIAGGLDGLLNPTPTQTPTTAKPEPIAHDAEAKIQEPEKKKGDYKTVCYSIRPELAGRMKYIAMWSGKTIGAAVSEAFEDYIAKWEKDNSK